MNRSRYLLFAILAMQACATRPSQPTAADRLAYYLVGDFSSKVQADEDASYFPINLSHCRIDRPDLGSKVLYVEQAVAENEPYRQRVYVIEAGQPADTQVVSRVFDIKEPKPFTGLCKDASKPRPSANDLVEKKGCAAVLTWAKDHFEGGTQGHDCATTRQGAAYTTSEIRITTRGLETWDRGFGTDGQQKWGAVKGPYHFVRKASSALDPTLEPRYF